MIIRFFRHRTLNGLVSPRAETAGDASQLANCLEADFGHPQTTRTLLDSAKAIASGARSSVALGGNAFSVEVDPAGATIEFQIDDQWRQPYWLSMRDLLGLARSWHAFVSSDLESGDWSNDG